MLQNELRKQTEFGAWEVALVDGWEGRKTADIEVEVDRPLFTYTFTYRITDTNTNIVLATGKITAWDGNGAAPKLAKRIIEDIEKVRATPSQAAEAKKSQSKN